MARFVAGGAEAVHLLDAGVAEADGPGNRRLAAPELAVDEVGDAPEQQADGRDRGDQVAQAQRIDLLAVGVEGDGDDDAQEAAVEAHAAGPQLQQLQPLAPAVAREQLSEHRRLVEEGVAETPAQDDAERDPQHQVVQLRSRHRRLAGRPQPLRLGQARGVPPAQHDPGDIGQGVPADGQGAEMDQNRVEFGEGHRASVSAVWDRKSLARETAFVARFSSEAVYSRFGRKGFVHPI
ncbi:hypothetical protein D3C85_1156580 [compost metagenome]